MRHLIIAITIILTACSPQRRVARILEKHPNLKLESTTIDSFITSEYHHDTTILVKFNPCDTFFLTDSFLIETPKFTTKGKFIGNKLHLDTKVKDTTGLIKKEIIPILKPEKTKCNRHPFLMAISFCIGWIFSSIFCLLFRKK